VEISCRVYKPRDPRQTSLFRLFDSLYERVKGTWEERFERSYGFWRGLVDEVVASYLACGLWQGGFARVRCPRCPEEFLVAFSCKRRGLCPSCGAKRAAEVAAFLQDEVVEQVGHAQWVFTIPRMLRIYFLHHRELLGALSRAGYETVKELMAAAVEDDGFRPGMVSVVQSFGEGAKFHPHVHALCSRGGWAASGEWIPLPYLDEAAAEKLFRHKVLALLRRRGLLSQERIELLDSWRRSGFSVHNRVVVHPGDQREFEALVRYMMRPPVSLSRLHFTPGSHEVVYVPKAGHDDSEPTEGRRIDAMEFVARILVQIPDPRRHLVRYYGAYSNASRGKRKKAAAPAEPSSPHEAPEEAVIPDGPYRAALRRRWAELIRRVYEIDPLICPRCGSEMRVIGFITQPALIDRILDHLRRRGKTPRPPPLSAQPLGAPA
jgi:putative transposase/transposase-like zinc-binding protein